MKKFFCLLIILSLISCEVQYDGSTRYSIKTTLVDNNGTSIKDIAIEVDTKRDTGRDDNITLGMTDSNGNFICFFPSLIDEGTYTIKINPESEVFQSKTIHNIRLSDFENYIFDLGTTTLYKNEDITTFSIDLKRINENNSIESIEINAITANENIYVNEPTDEEGNYYPENFYRVLKNQNFTVFYTVKDSSTTPPSFTDYSVNIAIGSTSVTYELEY